MPHTNDEHAKLTAVTPSSRLQKERLKPETDIPLYEHQTRGRSICSTWRVQNCKTQLFEHELRAKGLKGAALINLWAACPGHMPLPSRISHAALADGGQQREGRLGSGGGPTSASDRHFGRPPAEPPVPPWGSSTPLHRTCAEATRGTCRL